MFDNASLHKLLYNDCFSNPDTKNLPLKKRDICAEVNILNESEINVDQTTSYIPELKLNKITTGHLNNDEKNKLESIRLRQKCKHNQLQLAKVKSHTNTK